MSLRPPGTVRVPDPVAERTQREHELARALEAARTLQERLELLGDRAYLATLVRQIRDGLAADLAELAEPTCPCGTPTGDHTLACASGDRP